MFSNWRKSLFVVAIFVLISFCGFFVFAFSDMDSALLKEKIISRKQSIDRMCDSIDRLVERDADWDTYDYVTMISENVEQTDSTGTFCAVYDMNLDQISERTTDSSNADLYPMEYESVVKAVTENQRGDVVIRYKSENVKEHDMHIYYRWVPTDHNLQNRLLIILGVCSHSVDTKLGGWVIYGAVALIIVSAISILGSVFLFCQLGTVYALRGEDKKWRSKMSS